MKKRLIALAGFLSVCLVSFLAMAAEGTDSGASVKHWYAISAALAIAIASTFGALSQAKAASTALEAIGRNPGAAGKVQTPMIIGLALIESLVIYAFVIAILIQGNIAG